MVTCQQLSFCHWKIKDAVLMVVDLLQLTHIKNMEFDQRSCMDQEEITRADLGKQVSLMPT